MRISIIVPVYNTRDYIPRCLDSILKQRIKNMEIICVDDGSTDGSGELLDQYAELDARIKVIHQANAGLVQARKRGIEIARGEYAGYVDSDDWIEAEMYETLCQIADQYDVDMVSSGYILEKSTQIKYYDGFSEGLYQGGQLDVLRSQIFFSGGSGEPGIRPSLCNKLFRTSILRKVQMNIPDEVSNCEDRLCTAAYILESNSIYILKEAFYHYAFRRDSMSRQEDVYYLDKLGKVYRAFLGMYKHPNFSEKLRTQCELYIISKVLEGLNTYMGFSVSDLLWKNLKGMERFPEKSKIVLYGAGRLGRVYYRQIVSDCAERLRLVGWVDRNYQEMGAYQQKIDSPEILKYVDYDYVLLALADREPAEAVQKQIMDEYGVEADKIVWLEQHEVFWEYARAAGVIRG